MIPMFLGHEKDAQGVGCMGEATYTFSTITVWGEIAKHTFQFEGHEALA